MSLHTFFKKLTDEPEHIEFADVMATIADNYNYTPTAFTNGSTTNAAGSNEGSCKIFAFAKLHNLSVEHTLACFGAYYREDVLQHPQASDHANIRQFMQHGWQGIQFDAEPLSPLAR